MELMQPPVLRVRGSERPLPEFQPGEVYQLAEGEEIVPVSPPVIYLDGQLVDVIPMFEVFAESALEIVHHPEAVAAGEDVSCEECAARSRVPRPVGAPHSVSVLARACGFTEQEYEEVKRCLAEVEGMWQSLPPLAGAEKFAPLIQAGAPVLAQRFPTACRGQSKIWRDPLVQSLKWVRDNLGVTYPVIVMTEDSWETSSSSQTTPSSESSPSSETPQ